MWEICLYYKDTSVSLENIPLIKFIKTTSGTRVVYFYLTHEFIDNIISVITYHFQNFTYTFFKALLIFCHCRALFISVLYLKIIVNNVLYCCTVTFSGHNYFVVNKNLLFYRCLFVYIIIFYSLAALVHKILFCHSKIKFISSRHHVISSI